MIQRGDETRPAAELEPGEVISKEDGMQAETTGTTGGGAGLSTADLAGRGRDADRDGVPDAAERPEAASGPTTAPSAAAAGEERAAPLFAASDAEGYRSRWIEIQTGFVDDPRYTVEQADTLVAEVMKRLAEVFADERARLEEQWARGEEADTESLRVALRRYRSFFDRLLKV